MFDILNYIDKAKNKLLDSESSINIISIEFAIHLSNENADAVQVESTTRGRSDSNFPKPSIFRGLTVRLAVRAPVKISRASLLADIGGRRRSTRSAEKGLEVGGGAARADAEARARVPPSPPSPQKGVLSAIHINSLSLF